MKSLGRFELIRGARLNARQYSEWRGGAWRNESSALARRRRQPWEVSAHVPGHGPLASFTRCPRPKSRRAHIWRRPRPRADPDAAAPPRPRGPAAVDGRRIGRGRQCKKERSETRIGPGPGRTGQDSSPRAAVGPDIARNFAPPSESLISSCNGPATLMHRPAPRTGWRVNLTGRARADHVNLFLVSWQCILLLRISC